MPKRKRIEDIVNDDIVPVDAGERMLRRLELALIDEDIKQVVVEYRHAMLLDMPRLVRMQILRELKKLTEKS